ncbi:hypothetical protein PoB_007510800 [Plakobranchus ocellatus]|uniref:Uncharacterized protein n=1 Tax=Plakobranchus ocellatus TaxID=259542 RepID=A0AAV4DWH2_9GAST|nr:hypothetical protein PoB_007510800 [Plakobranchus ocellatus]
MPDTEAGGDNDSDDDYDKDDANTMVVINGRDGPRPIRRPQTPLPGPRIWISRRNVDVDRWAPMWAKDFTCTLWTQN